MLLLWASDLTDELKLAAESLQLPVRWNTAQRAGLTLAALVPNGKGSFTPSAEICGIDCDEGYKTVHVPPGELVLAARSQHGLANGLYDARRAWLVDRHKKDLAPVQLLSPGEHKPYFAQRETYHYQVLPRVKLRRIESQVKQSVAHHLDGLQAYRTMPFAQHVADYALFRKCWDPGLDLDAVMTELAAEWGVLPACRTKFVRAVRDLDAWWEEGDLAALREADGLLQELAAAPECSEFLADLRDQVVVLAVLGEFRGRHRNEIGRTDFYPPAELVERVYRLMLDRRIFEAYTVHQHWTQRAKEMIGQRLRWWLQAMTP